MSYATLNGLTCLVANGSPRHNTDEMGADMDQSPSGYFQRDSKVIKRVWDMQTTPQHPLDGTDAIGDALQNWIMSRGIWNIPFDTGYASKHGLNVNGGFGGSLVTTSPKYGARCWSGASSADAFSYRFPVLYTTTDWTVSVWHKTGGAWKHLVLTSNSVGNVQRKYVDAVASVLSLGCVAVSNPQSNVISADLSSRDLNGTSTAAFFDDLVVCNWAWSADMVSAVHGTGRRFPDAPSLELEGNIIKENAPVNVVGSVTGETYVQGSIAGSWKNNLRVLEVRLEEV